MTISKDVLMQRAAARIRSKELGDMMWVFPTEDFRIVDSYAIEGDTMFVPLDTSPYALIVDVEGIGAPPSSLAPNSPLIVFEWTDETAEERPVAREDMPRLIHQIETCNSAEALLAIVREWGDLKRIDAYSQRFRMHEKNLYEKPCRPLRWWVEIVAKVQMFLDLLEKGSESRFLRKREQVLVWDGFDPDEKSAFRPVLYSHNHLGIVANEIRPNASLHQQLIAEMLEEGMRGAGLTRRYVFLPNGQLAPVNWTYDLLGLLWLTLEATALELEGGRDLRMLKCAVCGAWDYQFTRSGHRNMQRARSGTGWYHRNCVRNIRRRAGLEEAAIAEGREYKPRPGSRKHGVFEGGRGAKKDAP